MGEHVIVTLPEVWKLSVVEEQIVQVWVMDLQNNNNNY